MYRTPLFLESYWKKKKKTYVCIYHMNIFSIDECNHNITTTSATPVKYWNCCCYFCCTNSFYSFCKFPPSVIWNMSSFFFVFVYGNFSLAATNVNVCPSIWIFYKSQSLRVSVCLSFCVFVGINARELVYEKFSHTVQKKSF